MKSFEINGVQGDHEGRVSLMALTHMTVVPFVIKAVATLGVPKILCDAGPDAKLTAEEIAISITTPAGGGSADPINLSRLLRVLAAEEIVKEFVSSSLDDPDTTETRYGPTAALKYLTEDDNRSSLYSFVQMSNDIVTVSPLQYLHAPVLDKNHEPFLLAHGQKKWEYIETHSRFQKVFHKGMVDSSHIWASMLVEKYKGFESIRSIVDVGGGVGATLAMILAKNPNLRGINFDLPEVVVNGVQAPRLEHVSGSFFESVPTADAVWMKWVLHDWDDKSCVKILKNIEKALPPNGKIINVDAVMPDTALANSSLETKTAVYLDIWMMGLQTGGRERTLAQFKKLGAAAGFSRVEIVESVDHLSLIEFHKS